jgi:putative tricarboxylic transport membrane protein
VTLKGTPEDRVKTLEEGLLKSMQGQMYSTYIQTSGQAEDSVVGRAQWQAQLDAMYKEAEAELKTLSAAPK